MNRRSEEQKPPKHEGNPQPPRESLLHELYDRVPKGITLGLRRMEEACRHAGNPQEAYPCVHIAGTNGKGSVAAMVASMARAEGLRVGLYTSPHLQRFNERISIGGLPISDDDLFGHIGRALELCPEGSFFEVTTLSAFLAFREAKVDLAVIEVGLGGRLDATNVLTRPLATAITRIALDHTEYLGTTLGAIAREKAGIAKDGVPLFLGALEQEAADAIDAFLRNRPVPLVPMDECQRRTSAFADAPVGLKGAHQRDNAVLATALALHAGFQDQNIRRGLREVTWPARLEELKASVPVAESPQGDPPLGHFLLDAAHNPDGAATLAAHLSQWGTPPEKTALVFGAMADKEWGPMLDLVAPWAKHRFYVVPPVEGRAGRAMAPPSTLAARHRGKPQESLVEALRAAVASVGPDGRVVICGSIYLVGAARSLLQRDPFGPSIPL